ncbi:hypothetical protein B0H19DRAFT_1232141 [Mycena capillaripes]|nr:hypothetical protein B0H19DRAFT_1232141 [Mycena capillaripes]
MANPAANHVPDEVISKILTPLLKHPDDLFSDRSEKALLEPGYSSAMYLLICKAWLRVSTPLLCNVVILCTTAQAEALQALFKTNPEIGQFIKKIVMPPQPCALLLTPICLLITPPPARPSLPPPRSLVTSASASVLVPADALWSFVWFEVLVASGGEERKASHPLGLNSTENYM